MDLLDAVRATLAVAMLCGAAVLDLRSRRVPNGYWLPFSAAAAALLAIDAGLHGPAVLWPLAASAGVAAFAYAAWRLRLFGGADAKALMAVAALVPTVSGPPPPLPFALDVLMDGVLAAVAAPLVLLAWNGAHGRWRLPAALVGVPMPLEAARRRHVWPMQVVGEDGRLRWKAWGFVGMDAEAAYARLEAAGVRQVWATAKVPLVALLALGAGAALLWGNLMAALARALVG